MWLYRDYKRWATMEFLIPETVIRLTAFQTLPLRMHTYNIHSVFGEGIAVRVLFAAAHVKPRAVAGLLLSSVCVRDECTLKDGRSVPGRAATSVSGDSNEKWHCLLLVVLSIAVLLPLLNARLWRRVLNLADLGHVPLEGKRGCSGDYVTLVVIGFRVKKRKSIFICKVLDHNQSVSKRRRGGGGEEE
ncbi:hypothetical protein NDU88_009959 [Pleurodeles waltl]|uniref:Uncharacterized protein n=1 Tax=Pleurodeles waltl TaxID=8319 RepID=A0AAV7RWR7_PLEWA|nr:hypothetical protein NDU88_009959 [Pleurodeles waltl]